VLIETVKLQLCPHICYTNWLKNKYHESVTIRQLKIKHLTLHEYSKILAGTPDPFQRHQGTCGHMVGDPCFIQCADQKDRILSCYKVGIILTQKKYVKFARKLKYKLPVPN
jgi:hypothetical protein